MTSSEPQDGSNDTPEAEANAYATLFVKFAGLVAKAQVEVFGEGMSHVVLGCQFGELGRREDLPNCMVSTDLSLEDTPTAIGDMLELAQAYLQVEQLETLQVEGDGSEAGVELANGQAADEDDVPEEDLR